MTFRNKIELDFAATEAGVAALFEENSMPKIEQYTVYIQQKNDGHWMSVGKWSAKSAAGAMQQFARDLKHFPDCTAIMADKS